MQNNVLQDRQLLKLGYDQMLLDEPTLFIDKALKVDREIIQRHITHTSGDKAYCSYDKSQMTSERRNFIVAWSDALLEQLWII